MRTNIISYDLDYRAQWEVKELGTDVIKCNKCKKMYNTTKQDISTKNPNYYFKTCKPCRDMNMEYLKLHPQYRHPYYKRFNTIS